jgi:DNA-binding NarL/FixJ family response regulator
MPIRVLIADDHTVVAEGLRHLVEAERDIEVVAVVGDGREAVQQARDTRPDVVLMDLSMPELNGADATRAILERDPQCRVIVLSMYAQREYVRRALKAGAAGYVVKRSAAKEVVEAIRAVHAGQRYLSARVADVVLDDYTDEKQDDPLARLSAREREVLQLLAEGRTGAQIAERLSLSQKTVETYRARLVEKLGIRDLAGLVRFAIQKGLVSLDEGPATPPSSTPSGKT